MKRVGTGTRAINFFIDTTLVFLITYIVSEIWKWYVFYYHIHYFNFGEIFAAILFIYYTIFETIFARTPGKWLSYTKVVNANGKRPSIGTIILRSLIRIIPIDMFFIPFLNQKALHDYVSKTEVVEA